MATTTSIQTHTGEDVAQTLRTGTTSRAGQQRSDQASQSSRSGASKSKQLAQKTGKRVEVQTTPERRTTVTRGATVSEVLRITPATRQVTTTYGHVACQFSLEIKIELGGQPTPVSLPLSA